MSEDEEHLMQLGMKLRDGIQDMLNGQRLRLADIPNDDEWLCHMLREMATLAQRVNLALENGE